MAPDLRPLADRFEATFESTEFGAGQIWRSTGAGEAFPAKPSMIPFGLHLAFGDGNVWTSHPKLGRIDCRGGAAFAMWVPEDGVTFETKVGQGHFFSFGVHISSVEQVDQDPVLLRIRSALSDIPMLVIRGHAAKRLTRLRFPIDPWFDGEARNVIMRSQALELIAVVDQTLRSPTLANAGITDRRRAQEVQRYVTENLDQALDLKSIASAIGINKRLMTEAFRKATGTTIGGFVAEQRMEEAARLLTLGVSVKHAAVAVGYTPNAFATAFRKHFGHPPSDLQP